MRDHVRILGYLHIVFSALGLLAAIAVFVVFGGIAGVVGMSAAHTEAVRAIPILGIVCMAICGFIVVLSLPGLIAGIGLLRFRPWARILTIVLSVFDLLSIPIGTALGFYGLWVLLRPETEALFVPATRPYGVTPG